MKQTYTLPLRLSDELMRKLLYISEAEGRTPNNQFLFMLRNNIQYFERVKGKIPPAALSRYDLSPYVSPADMPAQTIHQERVETEEKNHD